MEMDDVDCLGLKILSNVVNHLKSDPEIDEYDIIPVQKSVQNRNPVQLVEHKLGIESWGAALMYCSAAKDLKKWRQCGKKVSETEKDWLSSRTMCVLLMIPDYSTAWNIRKEMIVKDLLKVSVDLRLSELILTKHPKSSETFAHRRWLLGSSITRSPNDVYPSNACIPTIHSNFLRNSDGMEMTLNPCGDSCLTSVTEELSTSHNNDVPFRDYARKMGPFSRGDRRSVEVLHSSERHRLAEEELVICQRAADKYPSNYNAWSHRQWVLQHVACCRCQTVHKELETMDSFVWSHVSDHSGFHYRQFLLHLLTFCGEDISTRLKNELQLTTDLISSYPTHEAVWYHRRFALLSLMQHNSQLSKEASSPVVVDSEKDFGGDDGRHVPKRTRLELVNYDSLVSSENEWCQSVLAGCAASGWQQTLVTHHQAWLSQNMNAACSG